jgi:hypothetical protein
MVVPVTYTPGMKGMRPVYNSPALACKY